MSMVMANPEDVLRFWFGELTGPLDFPAEKSSIWFRKTDATDRGIRENFLAVWQQAAGGKLDSWAATPKGRLALIVLLDQFSRNMFREDSKAFSVDAKALALAKAGVEKRDDRRL